MPSTTSWLNRNECIALFLQGLPQAKIAARTGISQPTVSRTIEEFERCVKLSGVEDAAGRYGVSELVWGLHNLSVQLSKENVSVAEAAEGAGIIKTFVEMGVAPTDHRLLVKALRRMNEPGVPQVLVELAKLQEETGKTYEEAKEEYDQLIEENKQETITRERKTSLEEEVTNAKAEAKAAEEQRSGAVEELRRTLEENQLTIDRLNMLYTLVEDKVEELGWNLSVEGLVNHLKKVGGLSKLTKALAEEEEKGKKAVAALAAREREFQLSVNSLTEEREYIRQEISALTEDVAQLKEAKGDHTQALQSVKDELAQWFQTTGETSVLLNAIHEAIELLGSLDVKCNSKRVEMQARDHEFEALNTFRALLLKEEDWDFNSLYEDLTNLKRIREGEAPHLKKSTVSMRTRVRRHLISLLRSAMEEDIISRWDLQRETEKRDRIIEALKNTSQALTEENSKLKEISRTTPELKTKISELNSRLDEVTKEKEELSRKCGGQDDALTRERGKSRDLEKRLSENQKAVDVAKAHNETLDREISMLRQEKKTLEDRKWTLGELKEFHVRTDNAEIERRIQEELHQLTQEVWPKWHSEHHGEKVRVEAQAVVNQLAAKRLWENISEALSHSVASRRTFNVVCDKCQTSSTIALQLGYIDQLARTGKLLVVCRNPNCTDNVLFARWRHRFNVGLVDFLNQLTS